MSKKKDNKAAKDVKTPFPFKAMPIPVPVNPAAFPAKAKADQQKVKDFADNVKTVWEKSIDVQKSSRDAFKGQYNQFFDFMMDVQDTFFDAVPDKPFPIPGLPAFVISPKTFVNSVKDFEKLANDFFVEQADAATDFFIDSQLKTLEILPDLISEKQEEDEDDEVLEVEAEYVEGQE